MFPVFVNDGSQEMPDDDIMYIVSKEGVYLKKKLGIMESITPVKGISTLESIEMMATMHIKPIPGTLFAPVIDFFKKVYKEHRSEAIVLLFYNEEKRTYKIVPPAQKVSGAAVDYNRAMTIEDHIMVGDIHSHAGFSAFHSGVDDDDEKSFDGLHITIGNNNDDEVSISTSIVSNGQRFIADTMDYVNGLELTVDIDEVSEVPASQYWVYDREQKKMVPKKSSAVRRVRKFDKRYVSSVSKKYQKCPDEWLGLVEKKAYTSYTYGFGYGGQSWRQGNYWKNWDQDKFDRNAWRKQQNTGAHHATKPTPAPANKTVMTPPAASGPVVMPLDEDKIIPCESCPFQETALNWALEQFMETTDDDGVSYSEHFDKDGNPIDWYECDQCKEIFSTADEEAICPTCNVDDHLILLDSDDLEFGDEVTVGDSEGPIDAASWYQCNRCRAVIEDHSSTPVCNICEKDDQLVELHEEGEPTPYTSKGEATTYNYKCKDCATETDTLNNGQCPFCGGDVMDRIDMDAAIDAANVEDETLETTPLQVPDENKIPLGTRKKQKRRPGVFASLFQKRNKKQ